MNELQAVYNDLLALQDQTDQVPLTTALNAVGAALRSLDAAAKPWKCMAVSKAACAWPDCGCDPEATKVIQALVDQEWQAPNDAQGSPDVEQLRSELATSRDMCTKFEAAVGDDVGTILQLREQVEKLAAALRGFIPEDSVLDDCDCDDCRPVNEALALLRDVSLPSTKGK